jgi:plasmid stabilization system protein ParE
MAYQLRIQSTAEAETDMILDYLTLKSPQAASKFYKELHQCYSVLKEGVIYYGLSRFPELALQGYHAVLFNSYVMLYLEEGDVRTIAHIFHQKQDYANLI